MHYIYKTVPAQVYGSGGSIGSHVFYIDKGSDDGLKRDMAVITPDGIVGKVRDAFPHSSQVLASFPDLTLNRSGRNWNISWQLLWL